MSEFDILVAMATDFSNLRLFFEKVPQFAENVCQIILILKAINEPH